MARIYDIPEIENPINYLRFISPNSKVLEFGPSTGAATRYMKEKLNCAVTCVELIPEAAEQTKQYAEQMIVGDIDDDDWGKEIQDTFDFIIFADVLEHLRNPHLAIASAKRYLKNEGSIITSVPNIGHNSIILNLRKGIWEYNEKGLLDNTHIHFFTRKSLFKMFESINMFSVEEQSVSMRPCLSEFHTCYWRNPIFGISLIGKRDGHTYQFVNRWKIGEGKAQTRGKHQSIFRIMYELAFDFLYLCFKNIGTNGQNKIKKMISRIKR